jgi:mannose-6-phosphate isomerase
VNLQFVGEAAIIAGRRKSATTIQSRAMMNTLYPLRFRPLFRRYVWGGRRLLTVLKKKLGDGDQYAESWEIVDRQDDQSVVVSGSLTGWTLHQLVERFGPQLLGVGRIADRFPLLFKFLDANRNLSVQVHPNDQQAALLSPPDLGKTEAWLILDALPGSKVYVGLKRGFNRAALEREVARGTVELCLHCLEPRVGDCFLIPAGTLHALGAGLLVAEIQQSSDTTYRLFDWNRVGTDGLPRNLHVQQALATIDYTRGPITASQPHATERQHVECLARCDKFVLDRWQFESPESLAAVGDRYHILVVLAGAVMVAGDPTAEPLTLGQSMLVPAAAVESTVLRPEPAATLLDIYPP